MHPFPFSRMTPLYIILPNVLFTYTGYFLKICLRYTTGPETWNINFNPANTAVMTISRRISIPPIFNDSVTHLALIFHHSLSWHTHLLQLHQKVMSKINHLRSFSNSLPRNSFSTIYKTNVLPIFDYGSIIYDNCSDSDKHLLEKAQRSSLKSH